MLHSLSLVLSDHLNLKYPIDELNDPHLSGFGTDYAVPYSLFLVSCPLSLVHINSKNNKSTRKEGVGREPNDWKIKQQKVPNPFDAVKGDRGKRWERLGARGGRPLGGSTRASSFPVCPPQNPLSIKLGLVFFNQFLGGDFLW